MIGKLGIPEQHQHGNMNGVYQQSQYQVGQGSNEIYLKLNMRNKEAIELSETNHGLKYVIMLVNININTSCGTGINVYWLPAS